MIPNSYRKQNACVNCRFVEVISEHDCGPQYICMWGLDSRPRCGSVAMGETFLSLGENVFGGKETEAKYETLMNEWDDFFDKQEVQAHGICDSYQRKTGDSQ